MSRYDAVPEASARVGLQRKAVAMRAVEKRNRWGWCHGFRKALWLNWVMGGVLLWIGWMTAGSLWAETTLATVIDQWSAVEIPAAPEVTAVTLDPRTTALLILDIETRTCNRKRRPRCIESVPRIKSLLERARTAAVPVVYSLTSKGKPADILEPVAPGNGEPIVQSSVDKFFRTDLEQILRDKGIKTVIVTGTAAHGAVLHTATAAAVRGLQVVVPVDCLSAIPYAEQYTCWHLTHAPGSRRRTTLTRSGWIRFGEPAP